MPSREKPHGSDPVPGVNESRLTFRREELSLQRSSGHAPYYNIAIAGLRMLLSPGYVNPGMVVRCECTGRLSRCWMDVQQIGGGQRAEGKQAARRRDRYILPRSFSRVIASSSSCHRHESNEWRCPLLWCRCCHANGAGAAPMGLVHGLPSGTWANSGPACQTAIPQPFA